MIIIISRSKDESTNQVISWLIFYKIKYLRINFSDFINNKIKTSLQVSSKGKMVIIGDLKLDENEINKSIVWLRKIDNPNVDISNNKISHINKHIKKEYDSFIDSMMLLLSDAKWLCTWDAKYLNKIHVLDCARKCELNIPETVLTNSKDDVEALLYDNNTLITKCISDGVNVVMDDNLYLLSTSLYKEKHLVKMADMFLPSILQVYINKKIELRIFYLDGQFFSMAIFSQQQKHTKIDSRIVPEGKVYPRSVPYILPLEIETKLHRLMQFLNLNTGSIDMIYTTENQYVFLEVNPAGQYGPLSYYCNYDLDRVIANHLINATL